MADDLSPSPFKTSVIRTVVPFVVGWVVTFLVARGFAVDDGTKTQITSAVTVLVGALYYVIIRLLEQVKPKVGVLLGAAKPPAYDTTTVQEALDQALVTVNQLQDQVADLAEQRDSLNEAVDTLRSAAAKAAAKKAPAKKVAAKKVPAAKKAAPKAGN